MGYNELYAKAFQYGMMFGKRNLRSGTMRGKKRRKKDNSDWATLPVLFCFGKRFASEAL